MRQHPPLSEATQTTSNVDNPDGLLAWRERSLDKQNREVRELRSAFDHRMRELLTDDVVVTAAAVTEKYRTAWNQSLVKCIGNSNDMAQTKQKLRSAMDQSLRKELTNYEAIKALQEDYRHDYRVLVGDDDHTADGPLAVHSAAWADVDNFGMEVFEPPFAVTELLTFPDDAPLEKNLSSTVPSLGLLGNDITWRVDNTFGVYYYPSTFAGNDVALGIDFKAPQSGFLNVAVNMRNVYNRIHVSGTDNFGFSSATVNVYHDVFILLLRGGNRIASFRSVVSDGWVEPGGDDFSYVFPEIPEGPVVFVANFEDALHANEQLQILGGCQTFVQGDVSDMDCTATATLWWQLQKLYVWLT
jgi:hypothetical protein